MTAAEKILGKAIVASNIDSRQWAGIQAGLRDRAFFSSCVAEEKFLIAFRTASAAHAAGAADLSKLRIELRKYLVGEGYKPEDDERGTIKDLTTKARLDVIIKTNVATARGFVSYANGMSPGAYAAFPAMKLLRIRQRKQGRAWDARWKAAGDSIGWKGATPDFGTRTALKDSPIWQKLGDGEGGYRDGLGNPFPPFAWGSGVGVVDVSRKEAIELGLISDGELREKTAEMEKQRDAETLPGMNGKLQAEVPFVNDAAWSDWKNKYFGDQVQKVGDVVEWRDDIFKENFDKGGKFTIRLGEPMPTLLGRLPSEVPASDIEGKPLTITQDWLDRKRKDGVTDHRVHFRPMPDHPEDIPLEQGEVAMLPSMWRNPDRVFFHKGHLVLETDAFGGGMYRAFVKIGGNKLRSFYRTTEPWEEYLAKLAKRKTP